MKGTVIIAFIALVIIGGVVYLRLSEPPIFLSGATLDVGTITMGSFTCGTTTSVAIASLSGNWFRGTIESDAASVWLGSGDVTAITGIALNQSSSGSPYFDTGVSSINWSGSLDCVSNVTGTVVSYILGR